MKEEPCTEKQNWQFVDNRPHLHASCRPDGCRFRPVSAGAMVRTPARLTPLSSKLRVHEGRDYPRQPKKVSANSCVERAASTAPTAKPITTGIVPYHGPLDIC